MSKHWTEEEKEQKREFWRLKRENGETATGINQWENPKGYHKSYQKLFRQKYPSYYRNFQKYKKDIKAGNFKGTFKEYCDTNKLDNTK